MNVRLGLGAARRYRRVCCRGLWTYGILGLLAGVLFGSLLFALSTASLSDVLAVVVFFLVTGLMIATWDTEYWG